ncbi:MAG: nuclear transport factor 2 family protein [Myxococcales bacterium]|nr:MAG: nuclear transport factor 2 family protein [Myxococcales bacterium]
MSQHPHAELARSAWEAAAIGDTETLRRLCAPDLVWHASGRGRRSGIHRGLDEVFGYLAAIGDAAERFDSKFERILVGDDHVAVFFQVVGTRAGRSLDTGFILIFRIAADRIAEIWAVPRDQHAVDEFWG